MLYKLELMIDVATEAEAKTLLNDVNCITEIGVEVIASSVTPVAEEKEDDHGLED